MSDTQLAQDVETEIIQALPESDAPEGVAEPEAPQEPDVEAEARRLGWKPEDQWRGDKSGWVDAASFMEQVRTVPGKVRKLEADYADRFARLERMQEAALRRQAETHKAEVGRIKAQMRQAVEVGDVAQWERLDAQREQMVQDAPAIAEAPKASPNLPPETQAWVAKNDWFASDEVMRVAAQQLAGKAAQLGMGVTEQLAYVDREMPRYFPDKFRARTKPTHSAVEGLSLAAPRRGGKSAANLPSEATKAGKMFVAEGLYKNLEEYAADYFQEDNA